MEKINTSNNKENKDNHLMDLNNAGIIINEEYNIKDIEINNINTLVEISDNENKYNNENISDNTMNNELKLGEDGKKVYENVRNFEWTKEMEDNAKKIINENDEKIEDRFLNLQARNWDKFYKHNTTNFFKDRHYILEEFPELKEDDRVSNRINIFFHISIII